MVDTRTRPSPARLKVIREFPWSTAPVVSGVVMVDFVLDLIAEVDALNTQLATMVPAPKPDDRAAKRERAHDARWSALKFGTWLTANDEILTLRDVPPERFKSILVYALSRVPRYAIEAMPTGYPNMSDAAEEGFSMALDDWERGNDTWNALHVTRFRSVIAEAYRRGLDVGTDWNPPDSDQCGDSEERVRGWKAALAYLAEQYGDKADG